MPKFWESLEADARIMKVLCILCVCIQVIVSGLQARFRHCAAAIFLAPGLAEITIFGGCPEIPSNYSAEADFQPLAETTVLVLGEWTCWDMLHV